MCVHGHTCVCVYVHVHIQCMFTCICVHLHHVCLCIHHDCICSVCMYPFPTILLHLTACLCSTVTSTSPFPIVFKMDYPAPVPRLFERELKVYSCPSMLAIHATCVSQLNFPLIDFWSKILCSSLQFFF